MPQLSNKLDWPDANPKWASALNPVLANLILQGRAVDNISLIDGATTINHGLGRMQRGYFITDIDGSASPFRSSPYTATTLTLTSSAAVTVNLWVY